MHARNLLYHHPRLIFIAMVVGAVLILNGTLEKPIKERLEDSLERYNDNVSRAGLARRRTQFFLQTQRDLSLRGVQTVLSMLTISRHIPPHPCGDPLSDYGLPAGIPQDVPRDDTHHGLLLLDRVRWASMPALFLACC